MKDKIFEKISIKRNVNGMIKCLEYFIYLTLFESIRLSIKSISLAISQLRANVNICLRANNEIIVKKRKFSFGTE